MVHPPSASYVAEKKRNRFNIYDLVHALLLRCAPNLLRHHLQKNRLPTAEPPPPPRAPDSAFRYLGQCGAGFEGRLTDVVARLALSSAPDPAKMIADAAGAAAGAGAGAAGTGGGAEGTTARDRARAARAQSHAERALLELVKDLVGSFLADSFGLPSFARVLRVFVRTGFPAATRRVVWKELGDVGLLHLLDPPSAAAVAATAAAAPSSSPRSSAPAVCDNGSDNGGGGGSSCADDVYLYPADVEGAIVEAYLAALEHPRFGPTLARGREGQHSLEGRKEAAGRAATKFAGVTAAAAAGPAPAAGVAATGESVRGGEEESSSTAAAAAAAAGVSMWEVAVHHLACYLFSPPPDPTPPVAGADAATPSCRVGVKEKEEREEEKLPWQPDFGRRKTFERLLQQQHGDKLRGGRGATGSVAAAVLGHMCRGSAPGDGASTGDNGGQGGGRGGDGGAREVCASTSKLGATRRDSLRAYYRESGRPGGGSVTSGVAGMAGDRGAGGDSSSDGGDDNIVAWLDEDREINETVERLARATLRG